MTSLEQRGAGARTAAPVEQLDLLERESVLRLLDERLGEAASGHGRLVVVAGEAGVGKTTVIRRLCTRHGRRARVLWGTCDALFTPRPLGPLVDIADEVGGALVDALARDAPPHDVTTALAHELRRQAPTILVLEDVHWADEATLDVMRLLARKLEPLPALVVVSVREDELGPRHPFRVMLGELATSRVIERVRVQPLSTAAVAVLAADHDVDAGELYAKTSGNPFFVAEVLRERSQTIPETVRDAVLARVARLGEPARMFLEAVATVSPRSYMWLVSELAGPAVEHADECLGSGMLVADQDGVDFRHELARLAVYESIAPNRRLDLHRRALGALEDSPDGASDAAVLAHHAEAASDGEAALRYAIEAAGRAATVGAHREAAAQYARALRFGAALPPRRRAELLERQAASCLLTDQYTEGIAALEEALACRQAIDDTLGEATVLRRLSEFLWCPGRTSEAEARAREAVALLKSEGSARDLGLAYASLADRRQSAAKTEEALELAQRALEIGESLADDELIVQALSTIGACDPASGALELSLERAERAGIDTGIAHALTVLSAISVADHRYDAAQRNLDQGLSFCGERGIELHRLYLLSTRARLELDVGRWADAADTAESVKRVPRTSTTPRIHALVVMALVRARRGDPQVDELLEEAHELAWPTGELHRIAPVAAAVAEVAWLRGRTREISDAVDSALALALERRAPWAAAPLACWRHRSGHGGVQVDGAPEPWRLELAGRPLDAGARWQELGCPYDAALSFAHADDTAALRLAHGVLQELGAAPAAAIVARRLRGRGVTGLPRGPRPSTRANDAQLTTRELDVLALVSDGLRNADIAQRLFLSPRTVDHHVSAILRKLDAGSRSEAVATARRLGLVGGD